MAWTYLFIAGLLEIVWAIGLKYTEGFTKLVPSLVTGVALVDRKSTRLNSSHT